jgi:single-stranded DNA-binding protein
MTATLNKVQLIGNLGADPKILSTKDDNLFITASLATNEAVRKTNGVIKRTNGVRPCLLPPEAF